MLVYRIDSIQAKSSRNHKKIKTEYYYDQQVVSFGVEVKLLADQSKHGRLH